MASYIRVEKGNRGRGAARCVGGKSPYGREHDSRGIEREATPWQVWFYAVDAIEPAALKARVPESFHGLIDGEDLCPRCGYALVYGPGADRFHMELSCPACGGAWSAVDSDEQERLDNWAAWQVEHGRPCTLSEYWAQEAARRGEPGDVGSLIEEMDRAGFWE